ncbi:MAG: GDP-mannose 4,6-dehydratase [Nanoarchaeota archaeon]
MNKRILITGGAGFVGHHLIDHLLKKTNFDIISLDRLDHSGTLNRIWEILRDNPEKDRVKIVWHDLKAQLNDFIINKIGNVDYIFHIAASSHVDRSIAYPIEFFLDNIIGTANLLEYSRRYCPNLKMFLYFSTDEVFGPAPEGVFFKEGDRYAAKNPYSASKAAAEEICMTYCETYNLPIIITHAVNIYGKRQHPEKFIPLSVRKILNDEILEIHSNPQLTEAGRRYYLHVDDLAEALLFLIDKANVGEKYNLVAKEELSNLELAKMISEILGKKLKYMMIDPKKTRPYLDFRYALDGNKMKEMGWEPKIKMRGALEELIEWFKVNEEWLHLKQDRNL